MTDGEYEKGGKLGMLIKACLSTNKKTKIIISVSKVRSTVEQKSRSDYGSIHNF
jgi:hypothetical protein